MTRAVSISGMVVLGAVCALGAGCAFDASGTPRTSEGDDDSPFGADASVAAPADANVPLPPLPDAAPPPPPPDARGELRCPRATTRPVLDGQLEDWPAAEMKAFDMAQADQIDEGGFYSASMSASIRCAHDAERLYFGVVVHDDHRVVDSSALYDDDAVHFYLDARADAAGPYGTDDHEIVLRADGMYHDYAQGAAAVQLEGVVVGNGPGADFTIEISILKTSLGGASPLPPRLGFDLGFTDDDGFGAHAYGLWYLSQRPSCPDCCTTTPDARAWCDTTTFGGLELE
jgi:hypothetical protein